MSTDLHVAPSGVVTVQLDSLTDLTGWGLRLSVFPGLTSEFQEELAANQATFELPRSFPGRRYELTAIALDGVHYIVATGFLEVDPTPNVVVFAFEPSDFTGPQGPIGPQGPQGEQGIQGVEGPQNLFIQPDAPVYPSEYLWVETGLPPAGAGMTFWVEDGL